MYDRGRDPQKGIRSITSPLLTNALKTRVSVCNRNVKPGDRYLSIVCGNTERQTAVVQNMASFICPEVFHFLVRGAKSAIIKVLLMEKERIMSDKTLGSAKV